jgi:hypothetical protein
MWDAEANHWKFDDPNTIPVDVEEVRTNRVSLAPLMEDTFS